MPGGKGGGVIAPGWAACGDENVKAVVANPANTMPATAKLPIVLNLVMGPPMSGKLPGRVGPHRQSQADANKCPTRFERRLVGVPPARTRRGQHGARRPAGHPDPFGDPAGKYLVSYFASVDAINDQGCPIELADLIVEDPTSWRLQLWWQAVETPRGDWIPTACSPELTAGILQITQGEAANIPRK
jgi:hypothetical protein